MVRKFCLIVSNPVWLENTLLCIYCIQFNSNILLNKVHNLIIQYPIGFEKQAYCIQKY
jgi:hypothetical protein